MLYVKPADLAQVKIEFHGPGADIGDLAPVVLPEGVSRVVLPTAGHRVLVELGHPGSEASPPAVLLLAGPSEAGALPLAEYASRLRQSGLVSVLPHDAQAPSQDRADILLDTIAHLERCRNIDASRIGIVAFSESGSLALVVAALAPGARVLTLHGATMPAGMNGELADDLPRALLIAGSADAGGIASQQAIESLLQSRGIPCDVHVQDGVGPGLLEPDALADAWDRMFRYQLDFVR